MIMDVKGSMLKVYFDILDYSTLKLEKKECRRLRKMQVKNGFLWGECVGILSPHTYLVL